MITLKPLCASDLERLEVQAWQQLTEFELTPEYREYLETCTASGYSLWAGETIIAAGGVCEIHEHRGEVWMLLSEDCGPHFIAVNRIVRRFVASLAYKRLETTCEVAWPEAHRWLKLLGFDKECTARGYMPDGRDIDIYVRIR